MLTLLWQKSIQELAKLQDEKQTHITAMADLVQKHKKILDEDRSQYESGEYLNKPKGAVVRMSSTNVRS